MATQIYSVTTAPVNVIGATGTNGVDIHEVIVALGTGSGDFHPVFP